MGRPKKLKKIEIEKLNETNPKNIGNETKIFFNCEGCGKRITLLWKFYQKRKLCRPCFTMCDEVKSKRDATIIKKYGKTQLEMMHSEESHNKIRKAWKNNKKEILDKSKKTYITKYGVNHPMELEIVREKMINSYKEKYGNDYRKKFIEKSKKTCIERYGTTNPDHIHELKCKMRRRYKYDNHSFDSSWELATWIYFKDHNRFIERNHKGFDYYNPNDDKWHKCYPDFKVEHGLLEIKGNHLIKMDNWLMKEACYRKNQITVYFYPDIAPFLKYVHTKYGKNYMRQFKIY